MKWIAIALAGMLGAALLFVGSVYVASELGGEVVVLHRPAPDGSTDLVRVWIVEDDTGVWIEHGGADAPWMQGLTEEASIELEREGAVARYHAVVDPAAHARYHELRQAKYGWADALVALATTSASECTGAPVRLEAVGG